MRKRSKYKPKGVRLDVMTYVRSGLMHIDDVKDAGVTLKIKNHASMASLVKGEGTRDDVDVIIGAMNVAEALALNGKGKDWWSEIRDAQNAILSLAQRGLRHDDRFVFTGLELKAINLGMDIHDAQLTECTVKELEDALNLVTREIKLKRARVISETAA